MNDRGVALLRTTISGELLYAYFNDTSYKTPTNIFAWFSKDTIFHSALNEAVVAGEHTITSHKGTTLALIVKPLQEGLLWHVDFTARKPCNTVHRLLDTIVTQYDATLPKRKDSGYYFDAIQKMNNELINKTREISKMNRALNKANAILNNRLVKDPLTHLVSRYQYPDEMMHTIIDAPDKKGVFCFIDLDGFKAINDTYGHAFGDVYLIEVANRLKRLPLKHPIAMRIAGDEFGLYIHGFALVDAKTLETITATIETITQSPFIHEGVELPLRMSMGTAIYNEDTTDIHALIDYADKAMYYAKKHNRDPHNYFAYANYQSLPSQ